jgi:integrase/recombinase XerD
VPRHEPRLHLPYGQWPAADRLLWVRSFCNYDPFAEAAGARLAKASQRRCLFAWRRFLGFLTSHEPAALEDAPGERLTIERIRAFVSDLAKTNAPTSVASVVGGLYQGARFMIPEADWAWLKNVKSRLHAAAPAKTSAAPVITSVQLLDLGQKLMDESKPAPGSPLDIRNAVRYRDGLMIALVAFVPIRPRNLTGLEIGRHLVKEGDRWSVIIPREETKTGTAIDFQFPELLEPYLAFYLDVIRPRILRRATCAALWVSLKGGALSQVGIGISFNRLSARLGFRVTPHDARDAAATTWAVSAPAQIGVARDLLAHSDLRTTIKYYNRARGIEASRAYSRMIAGMRTKQNLRGTVKR